MKEIPLDKGHILFIDNEDYEEVSKLIWKVAKRLHTFYAISDIRKKGHARKVILLHRLIMKAPKGTLIDHINGNGLDNRKSNLRYANKSKNAMNMSKHTPHSSPYKGVSYDKDRKKFRCNIGINGKQYFVGRFDNELEAAKAYNKKALTIYGEYARLNVLEK